ncbi:MAG: DegV family protein [Ruminococcaceae bacterium]|nr:DegV family protein [Oscillospiraceae bacterium]
MNSFVIITDSGCDLSPATLAEWNVPCESLTFRFDNSEKEYSNSDMSATEFYAKMREGSSAKTAAINSETFKALFEKYLSEGKDVLYVGFSSGLSTTYNSGRMAAAELAEKYPDRKILTVDTLAASAGQGLILYLALQKQKEGATIDEVAAYVDDIKFKTSIWFTVDDLVYLKRGGRVSPTVAFVGNMLGIKPILHMDNDGHLINVSKVRGRRAAIAALCDKFGALNTNPTQDTVFISHGDCENDAKELARMINEKYGATIKIITDVGPVIGSHSGPGTLALFFVGKER